MKINQKQLNEMIRKSILKRLNEDVQGTSDDLQSRMDKIKWYFETPTYLMKNKGKQNQEEVENGTGRRTELKNAYTRWKNENYIDGDFIKFNFNNRSLEFIPCDEIDEQDLTDFVNYIYNNFSQKFDQLQEYLNKYDATSNSNNARTYGFKLGSLDFPTAQVKYELKQDSYNGRYIEYLTEMGKNGKLKAVMNYDMPGIKFYKIGITKKALKDKTLRQEAIKLLDLLIESVKDVCGEDKLLAKANQLYSYGTEGVHPFTGEVTNTIHDKGGYTRFWNKETGEEMIPSNYSAMEDYVTRVSGGRKAEIARQKEEKKKQKEQQKLQQNNSEPIEEGRKGAAENNSPLLKAIYHDENGVEIDPRTIGVHANKRFNDIESFPSIYELVDENDQTIAVYLMGSELQSQLQGKFLKSLVYEYSNYVPQTCIDSYGNLAYKNAPSSKDGLILTYQKFDNIDAIDNEEAKEYLIAEWEDTYSDIALEHNQEVSDKHDVKQRNYNKNGSNLDVFSITESKLSSMILESIKRHIR